MRSAQPQPPPNPPATLPEQLLLPSWSPPASPRLKLLRSANINIPTDALDAVSNPAELILLVNLDETGTPTGMHVVRSINPEVDSRVMKAVRSFRWRPAVLDNQTIPVDVNLVVQVQH